MSAENNEDIEMEEKEGQIQNNQRIECLDIMEKIVEEFGELKDLFFGRKLDLMKLEIEEIKIIIVFCVMIFFTYQTTFNTQERMRDF